MRAKPCVVLVVCVIFLLAASCSPGDGITPEKEQRISALGEKFVEELNTVIPQRDDALSLQAVSVANGETRGLELLYEFYESYKVGQDAELTIIFKDGSFVVYKIVFEGVSGYFFRYETDSLDVKSVDVYGRPIDKINIMEDLVNQTVSLRILKSGRRDTVVTFKNIIIDED